MSEVLVLIYVCSIFEERAKSGIIMTSAPTPEQESWFANNTNFCTNPANECLLWYVASFFFYCCLSD
jgi:hypothetical protein